MKKGSGEPQQWSETCGPHLCRPLNSAEALCEYLRFAARICGFLQQSAVFCENLRLRNAVIPRKHPKNFSGFLNLSGYFHLQGYFWRPFKTSTKLTSLGLL